MSNGDVILEMRGVDKSFSTARGLVQVLRSVDATIEAGAFTAITGPSGSGKSTFLNLAGLLDHPSAGSVLFEGRETAGLGEEELSEIRKTKVGIVFQNFFLLPHRSVIENVMFRFRYLDISDAEARERSEDAMATIGIADLAAQPVRLLSGGEMQRVGIARAVALRPALLLADEPTGNLDGAAAGRVMESFQRLNAEGISIILATHNEKLLGYCSRHLVCSDGKMEESGR